MISAWTKKVIRGGIVTLCLVAILAPISPNLSVNKAEACFFGIGCDSVSDIAIVTKEYILDGIAHTLAKQVISQITSSLVRWINSGFEGSPAFVTDLDGFLLDIADQVAGQFIDELGLGIICSPFQLQVRAALDIQYYQRSGSPERASCTFTGALENLENFGKSIENISWTDWFQITARPENNQYGALMLAQASLDVSIRNAQGEELKLLEFGEGFLSLEQCETVAGGGEQCSVVTPGQVLADQLNRNLDSGREALITADEIDEIIGALLGQLVQQAVTGVNGLIGLTEAGSGGTSYIDELETDPVEDGGGGDENPITEPLAVQEEVLGILTDITTAIDEVEELIPETCTLELPDSLTDTRSEAETEVTNLGTLVSELQTLSADWEAASGSFEKNEIYTEFAQYEASGDLYAEDDITALESERLSIFDEVADFEDEIDDECTTL